MRGRRSVQSLVIDFSKVHGRGAGGQRRGAHGHGQPGINIDLLNRSSSQHGLMFGPTPSSGNRATAGGVVANNSTGSHSILYGMTGDNVRSAMSLLADGSPITLGPVARGEAGRDRTTPWVV